ncbi:MAG: bifunctional diaminohydroxyphosphoribosylaminopyrimidine deaminase/5-amino-6-(5-phosphoribosylamino)uracil reductase RibD [Labilithrix sp.]|nr:bifunctional diaminohydroxyphosphoribosylaminopyrimidine deaminase/5-amino-6-(5-phosphoribosylamino)uracil reductase RibD [Labilithrix sp.]MCW5817146.1 bifunctional diaminohydroxyphosphoribosylaminopyrimidine deaminase/5-amino-6-(5-phosphoribosylamino)uracil reductase RibD [Labilithrix sp.]
MDLALVHGRSGKPSPNPHVGAVLVKNGELVATGHHERAGTEHAEVLALKNAGAAAEGSTLYVTLEPCNHHGRTPPCTDAIVQAKIARVVIGCRDPNPHVDGGGAEVLTQRGVAVTMGIREAHARGLIQPWTKYVTTGLPYISLKLALSLDGRIATRSGASKWVTGPDARAKVHLLRSRSDAVAVGIGTAVADDPRLTVRDAPGDSPVRIVFDTNLRLPLESRLVTTAREIPTIVLAGPDAQEDLAAQLAAHGVEVVQIPLSTEGRLDMVSALRLLAQRGCVSLLVEGGAELAGSLLAGRLADELHAFIAPILLGPRGRPGAVDWAGPDTPQQAPRIAAPAWELVGEDAYVHGPIVHPD